MRLLQWKAEYKTGIAEVDRRHRSLIAEINRLQEALDRGELSGNGAFFRDLYAAVEKHFAGEEASMREAAHPSFMQHKQDHDRLLDDIREFAAAFENSEEIDSVELSGRLDLWCTRHFTTHDARGHRELFGAKAKEGMPMP